MAEPDLVVERFTGDLEALSELFQMSTGIDSAEGLRHIFAVERARGTRYFVARSATAVAGFVGLWLDAARVLNELEPPQIVDIAVRPEHRRRGVARALVELAARETRAAGFHNLWLITDGNSPALLTFYRRLGFRLAAAVPDWFGDGSVKAIFRRTL